MGQAKQRGTYEQRVAQSALRNEERTRQAAKERILREGLRDVVRPETIILASSMAVFSRSRLRR
jgi:hypothetical protein